MSQPHLATPSRMALWRNRCILLAGSLLCTGVLLEAGLQSLSWSHYVLLNQSAQVQLQSLVGETAERRVLCVGDSFTFGIGASSNAMSYPAQLEQLLNAASSSDRWRVLNFSKPGMTSSELRQHFATWLTRIRPTHVCVLIGLNDLYGPDPAPGTIEFDEEDPETVDQPVPRWQWKYRTRTLLASVFTRLREHRARRAVVASRAATPTPQISGVSEDTIIDLWKQGKRLWERGAYEESERVVRKLLRQQPDHLLARISLARALQRQFKLDEARNIAESIYQRLRSDEPPDTNALVKLARFYFEDGQRRRARVLVDKALEFEPEHLDGIFLHTDLDISDERYEEAQELFAKVESIDPHTPRLYRKRANLWSVWKERIDRAYKDIATYYQLTHDRKGTFDMLFLVQLGNPISQEQFEQWLGESHLSPSDVVALIQIFTSRLGKMPERNLVQQLQRNLQAMSAKCDAHGIPLIVLGYPEDTEINALLQPIIRTLDVPYLDVEQHIRILRATHHLPKNHFRVRGNHPNDQGYREMARVVADYLLEGQMTQGGSRSGHGRR